MSTFFDLFVREVPEEDEELPELFEPVLLFRSAIFFRYAVTASSRVLFLWNGISPI